jgi:adenylate cyclase
MVAVVFQNRGTVDKFVGDMIMALYGAPLDDEDHAEHAVQTALAMITTLQELNVEWARDGKPQLDIGIGINTGDMIAGNVGSDTIMSYTVIGGRRKFRRPAGVVEQGLPYAHHHQRGDACQAERAL